MLQKATIAAHTNPLGAYVPAQTATYKWLADGTKASVVDAQGNGFAYLGSLTYKLMNGVPVLESTSHGSGRIVVKDGAGNGSGSSGGGSGSSGGSSGAKVYDRQYHITDHLGSVRVVFNQDGEVLARNDFYPFGKPHANPSLAAPAAPSENRFLYNGKEKQLTAGLSFLDFGARMYDNEIGRWFNPDPLAEKFYGWSIYNYAYNNPLRFIDPDGMAPGDVFKTVRAAAKDWGNYYNGASISRGVEFGSTIYKTNINGNIGYAYSIANEGTWGRVTLSQPPNGETTVTDIHSHGI